MIIDFLDKYPIEEQDKILDMAERWYIHEYRRSGTGIDLYGVFNDLPYWGEGKCECEGTCPYNYDDETECDHYDDSNYNEWFAGIITKDEKEQIDNIEQQIVRQMELFKEDDDWNPLHINISYRLMKWLNERDITYCIIRGLASHHDYIFLKNFYPDAQYRLLFGQPTTYDMKYAVDTMGWVSYGIRELTATKSSKTKEAAIKWIKENSVGLVHLWNDGGDTMVFEDEIDAMAIKLRWTE